MQEGYVKLGELETLNTWNEKKNELMIFSSDLVITQDGPTHLLMLYTLNMNMFCEQHRLFYWTLTTNRKIKCSGCNTR